MRLTIHFLGLELLTIEASTSDDGGCDPAGDLSGGTTYSTAIGFAPSPGDQRWESGVDYQ